MYISKIFTTDYTTEILIMAIQNKILIRMHIIRNFLYDQIAKFHKVIDPFVLCEEYILRIVQHF